MNKPLVITLLAITVAALSATAALRDKPKSKQDYVFSGKPVVEFEGRITHATTGAGIPEVYVLVNMRTYRAVPFTHHGVSGCQDSSQVVKTDAEGRYRVYWSWAEHNEEVPDDLSVQLKIYKPGWEYYPVVRPRISWYSVDEQHDFKLVEDGAPFEHRLDFVRRVMGDNCPPAYSSPAGIEMQDAISREVWAMYCEPEGVGYNDLSYVTFDQTRGYLLDMPFKHYSNREPKPSESQQSDYAHMLSQMVEKLLPDFPWQSGWTPPPVRDFTREEKDLLCTELTPDTLLKRFSP